MAEDGREANGRPSAFDVVDDDEGRSSSVGGTMPSSVWSQSIWINMTDSWLSRLDWRISVRRVRNSEPDITYDFAFPSYKLFLKF
jgi:hypothetical protein